MYTQYFNNKKRSVYLAIKLASLFYAAILPFVHSYSRKYSWKWKQLHILDGSFIISTTPYKKCNCDVQGCTFSIRHLEYDIGQKRYPIFKRHTCESLLQSNI